MTANAMRGAVPSVRIGLAVCCVFVLAVSALAQRGPAKAEVTPIVERDRVAAGSPLRAALKVHLPEGYHVNANKPRDPALIPIVLTVDPPAGFTVTEIVYPKAVDLVQRGADQPLAVYEHDFAIGVVFKVARDVSPGEIKVPASLRYQACDETMCYIPTKAPVAWTVAVTKSGPSAKAHADVFGRIAFGEGEAPAAAMPVVVPTAPGPAPPQGEGTATLGDFTVSGMTGGYLGTSDFLDFIHNAEAGIKEKGWFEGRGPLAVLLIVFLGGLALNLTPCVLPMIPINLAIIGAGAQAGSRSRGLLLGAAYGAAMAVVYGALGLIVILTAGTFGTINASPWFNAGIALLFIVLALAMFDVVVIDFSRFSDNFKVSEAGRGSFVVAFGMGAVAALLAGACVAPVVIQVVLFSSNLYAGGNQAALALPFLLGIGMAVPWPIAGAGIAALPRPGAWMVRIKQVFGVVILATALYYGYEAYSLFASRWVDAAEVSASVEEKLKEGWHASLPEGLATARRERKPVLIDLWATWCKNCLVMDRTTLQDQTVKDALAGYVRIKFQAERPDESPTREIMQQLNASGLPTYVLLKPKS
jgi:cytochrome c biogenesis protein CcdA/thiol-disulfide isomerase/thioredoxin